MSQLPGCDRKPHFCTIDTPPGVLIPDCRLMALAANFMAPGFPRYEVAFGALAVSGCDAQDSLIAALWKEPLSEADPRPRLCTDERSASKIVSELHGTPETILVLNFCSSGRKQAIL